MYSHYITVNMGDFYVNLFRSDLFTKVLARILYIMYACLYVGCDYRSIDRESSVSRHEINRMKDT